jgi:hypothetical protein
MHPTGGILKLLTVFLAYNARSSQPEDGHAFALAHCQGHSVHVTSSAL